jgi:hypothetical protein
LKYTMAAIPGGNTRRTYGTAFFDGSLWFANVGGNLLTCRWLDTIEPVQGAPIVVDIATDERGQSSALVLGAYADQPLTPAAPIPPANIPTPAGGGSPITGTHRTAAIKSDTYGVGGWGRWATSQRGGEDVYTGSYGGYTMSGSWFYGAGNTKLAGKTIKAARFRLPGRLRVGNYNAPATIHIYAHTSKNQPGGDVTRTVGPFNVTVEANSPPKWVTLPSTFHAVLAAGGGISIIGDPYAGFTSRLKDPDSGKTELDWSN